MNVTWSNWMEARCARFGLVAAATLFALGGTCPAQQTPAQAGQHPQAFRRDVGREVRADYLLYLPEEFGTAQQEWPLILFLHGAGERGHDVSRVAVHGPPKLAAEGARTFPFVIVSPQCPTNDWWASETQVDTLIALLDDVVSRYPIDEDRVYLTGLSMGGYGTWRLAAAHPDRFAAIAPICGGGNPEDASRIAQLPVWAFHGAKDEVVPIRTSEEMVAALKRSGNGVKFTVYPEAGHDSWTATYENPELFTWFLQHTRSENGQHTPNASD